LQQHLILGIQLSPITFASAKIRHQIGTEFLIGSSLLMAIKLCFSELGPEGLDKSCTIPLLWGIAPNERRCLFFLPPQAMHLRLLVIICHLQRGSIPFKQNVPLLEGLILLRNFLQCLVLPSRVTLPYLGLITSMPQFF
jgi:hypothetical protein